MLQLSRVSKLFHPGTPDEKIALIDINLHLAPGDFVTVIGSNGAGKSTLMNMISGVIKPDAAKSASAAPMSDICRSTNGAAGSAACFRTRWPGRRRI
ncbi:hypothetical protein HMSSN036_56970 [Paenibacillus macerans]|nr:hypothetical protein HMSSN036_56970 [Paenibacillus macerans]